MPALWANPIATTFALAPIIVAFPPKSAPKANAHQSTSPYCSDIPADNLYYDAAQSLLLSVPGVQNVIVNPVLNEITIQNNFKKVTLTGHFFQ